MIKQWILLLSFTNLALSSDLQDDSSTQLPFSSTTISPQREIASQKSYQDVLSEEQVQQTASAAENSGTSSNANVFYPRLYHILSNNPDAISAIFASSAENKIPVQSHQHVTVHPPTANHVSNIPVPVLTQPLHQYIQTVEKPTPIQYISAPVGYSQVYQNPEQELVTVQQQSGASVTSESQPRPISPSIRYHSVAPATGATQPPFFYPVAMKEVPVEAQQSIFAHPPSAPPLSVASPIFFYPTYHQPQGIVNRVEARQVFAPTTQTGHNYKTVATKPSSSGYLKYPEILSPSVHQVQTSVSPESVQYILAPIKQVKINVSKPIYPATIKAHKSIIIHPPSPTVAPMRNVQVVANSPAVPLMTIPSTPVINHHGFPMTILIPVMYNTESLSSPQYVEVNKPIQSAQGVVSHHAPVSKPIPIPVVAYPNNEGHVMSYNYKDRVVGYALATNVLSQHGGYSKAVEFSPSSEVSSVRFSGNGVKYEY